MGVDFKDDWEGYGIFKKREKIVLEYREWGNEWRESRKVIGVFEDFYIYLMSKEKVILEF